MKPLVISQLTIIFLFKTDYIFDLVSTNEKT